MSEHRWRLRRLNESRLTGESLTPEALVAQARKRPGLYLVYTFTQHVAQGQGPGSATAALGRVLDQTPRPVRPRPIDQADGPAAANASGGMETSGTPPVAPGQAAGSEIDLGQDGLYYLLPKDPRAPHIEGLFQRLRLQLESGAGAQSVLLVTGAGIWDALHQVSASQLVVAPRVYEYLLWEAGGPAAKPDADTLQAAWAGWGWIGKRYRDLPLQEPLHPVQRLASHLAAALDGLVETTGDGTVAAGEAYRLGLGGFLPPFYPTGPNGGLATSRPIPTLPGSWGGPRAWSGQLLDLDGYTRHLLLDGWLVACPVRGVGDHQWWLYPASLLQLAWLARVLHKPHTETPEAFLAGYDWGGDRFNLPADCCAEPVEADGGVA